jgi:putative oxidoreductase
VSTTEAMGSIVSGGIRIVNQAQDGLAVVFRLAMAQVFWAAGMSKIASWSSTLDLFAYEYAVPLIPSTLAAYMATGAELLFPVLLVIGLGTRVAAGGLFILNAVAAISYPDISPAGINDHYFWGAVLLSLFFYGPGRLSLDHFISRKWKA